MINEFVFTYHAACRWFERFENLDFMREINSAKRDKSKEKHLMRIGKPCRKIYVTRGGVAMVVHKRKVVTVYGA